MKKPSRKSKRRNRTAVTKRIKFAMADMKAKMESKYEIDFQNADRRIKIYNKNGVLKKSFQRLRKRLDIEYLSFEEDYFPVWLQVTADDEEITDSSVYNSSRWIDSLTDEEFENFQALILKELARLKLPLALSENYISTLLWGGELKPNFTPQMIYPTALVGSSKSKRIIVNSKLRKEIKAEYRMRNNLPAKGVIPKEFRAEWEKLEQALNSGSSSPRRLRATKLYEIASEPKQSFNKFDPVYSERRKRAKETDAELYDKHFQEGLEELELDKAKQLAKTRKNAQRLRKARERLNKMK
jgi:hypothetical protein